ncbi:HopJ type III effector protein [Chryseobacterium sp.]|nr:HopJ type III effector protein [Chryseobacterium sp.]
MNQQTSNVNHHQNIRNFKEFGWEGISFEGKLCKQKGAVRKFPGCFRLR